MNKFYKILKGAVIAGTVLLLPAAASAQAGHATVTCSSPGSLKLTKEALAAKYLTVKGELDARDFATLKTVTMTSLYSLDLTDVNIHAYTGYEGTYPPSLSPDWIVGDGDGPVTYPANQLPAYFTTETRDNSLHKFHEGSTTLTTLILPKSLKGFMPYAFTGDRYLYDMKVPDDAEHITAYGNGIYTKDKSTLLAVAPGYCGNLTVAATTTKINDYALNTNALSSITFEGNSLPTFGKENPVTCAYVTYAHPDEFNAIYPDVDCIESLTITDVECDAPGQLMAKLGNMGYTRSDVRGVKVIGSLNYDDLTALLSLPNLHHADLAEATVSVSGCPYLEVSNPALVYLTLPQFDGRLSFALTDNTHFTGHLDVPKGIEWVNIYPRGLTSLKLPSTIYELAEYAMDQTLVRKIDLSECGYLKTIKAWEESPALEEVLLPPSVTVLTGIEGPVKSINLPNGLQEIISSGGWMVESLVLPESLEFFSFGSLPIATTIDASKARNLNKCYGLNNAPLLQSLDFSMCPIIYFNAVSGDETSADAEGDESRRSPQRIVVSGGTRYPEPKICGVKELKLPSTVSTLSGIRNCPGLERLDLMQCFRLERLEGIENCENLKTLTLPSSSYSFSGLSGCQSLDEIKTASQTPPALKVGDDFDYSKVSVYVPNGWAGAYRMTEGWERCKAIIEGGYVVTISLDECAHLFSNNTSSVNVNGAGLYAEGETAHLEGLPSFYFSVSGWNVDGEYHSGSSLDLKVTGDVTASPVYEPDYSLCDLVLTIDSPVAQTMKMGIGSYKRKIIVNGRIIDHYYYDNYNEKTVSFSLDQGTNTLAINGDFVVLQFDHDNGLEKDEHFAITSFDINNKNALRYLYPTYFKMERLEIKDNTAFGFLSSRGDNEIREVIIEDCPQLDQISLHGCGMEKLTITGLPLNYLGVWGNKLTELDLTEFKSLVSIDAESNRLVDFKMDAPDCQYLYLSGNPMAFSTLTQQMYDIYMRNEVSEISFIIEDGDIDPSGSVDLSAQMFPPECDVKTDVMINWQPGVEIGDGVFEIEPGRYDFVQLTNEAFPGLKYMASFYLDNSGVEGMEAESDSFNPVEVYDIQGRKVNGSEKDLPAGLYIIRQGSKVSKVMK